MPKLVPGIFCAMLCACAPLPAEVVSKKTVVGSFSGIDEILEAGGYFESGFDPYHREFKKDCPISDEEVAELPSGEREFFLVSFGRTCTTHEISLFFEQSGLRAADIPELLLFGTAFPELPEDLPRRIVALGEECAGDSYHSYPRGTYYPNARIARYSKNFREIGTVFSDANEYNERWWNWAEGHPTYFLALPDGD